MRGERLTLAVCPSLRAEVAAVLAGGDFSDVDLAETPLDCSRPSGDWAAVIRSVPGHPPADRLCVMGGACLPPGAPPGGSSRPCRALQATHCTELVVNPTLVQSLVAEGAYLVTPGWLANWRGQMARWGFDAPLARQFFGEFALRIVLLDTGVGDPDRAAQLEEFAEFVGLPASTLEVGLEMVALRVGNAVQEWRLAAREGLIVRERTVAHRRAADQAMMLDLLGTLAAPADENELLLRFEEIFRTLLPPHSFAAATIRDGVLARLRSTRPERLDARRVAERLAGCPGPFSIDTDERGFVLRLAREGTTVGVLVVADLAPGDDVRRLANDALTVAAVCGMAIGQLRLRGPH